MSFRTLSFRVRNLSLQKAEGVDLFKNLAQK